MTILTGCGLDHKKQKDSSFESKEHPKNEDSSVVDVKDTKVLVEEEEDGGEMPLPNMEYKQPKRNGKKVTFDVPINDTEGFRHVLLKTVIILGCLLFVVSLGRYALERYRIYEMEKHFKSGNVHVIYQINGTKLSAQKYEQLMMKNVKKGLNNHEKILGKGINDGKDDLRNDDDDVIDSDVGKVDEWFSVGKNEWKMATGDKHKNYSILTDAENGFTAVRLVHNPKCKKMAMYEGDESLGPVCYVTKSALLKLPSIKNVSKFLDQVDKEAEMIVTKLSESLFFDIGQPIDLDVSKYGHGIHEFCSGTTSFELIPMNLVEEMKKKLESEKHLVPLSGGTKELRNRVYDVVDQLDKKMKREKDGSFAASEQKPEPTVADVSKEPKADLLEPIPSNEEVSGKYLDQESGVESKQDKQTENKDQGSSKTEVNKDDDDDNVDKTDLEDKGEQTDFDHLHRINSELINMLNSGNILDPVNLFRQFHQIVAYLPSGNYNLHSPHGIAVHFQIRRQVVTTIPLSSFNQGQVSASDPLAMIGQHYVPLFPRIPPIATMQVMHREPVAEARPQSEENPTSSATDTKPLRRETQTEDN